MKYKTRILAGKKSWKGRYYFVPLKKIVGRTVEAVGLTRVESASESEPCVILYFDNGTQHGFVLPAD